MREVRAKVLLSSGDSMNVYRGCTHGCIYCDSRSACYQIAHAFEDVEVKVNAPELLEEALRKRQKRKMIFTGSMSDPYLPLEARVGLTRRCLEVIERYGFGATVLTKSDLVLRDLELLKRIHRGARCVVQMTLTTHDEALCKKLEPNVCTTKRRAEVLNLLRDEGVPTVVWMTPILPFINDTEENLRGLLDYCIQARVKGIITFGMGVTLRDGDRQYFYKNLDRWFPGLKQKYIDTYGERYILPSPNESALMRLLEGECERHGILSASDAVFAYLKDCDFGGGRQLGLFDGG